LIAECERYLQLLGTGWIVEIKNQKSKFKKSPTGIDDRK